MSVQQWATSLGGRQNLLWTLHTSWYINFPPSCWHWLQLSWSSNILCASFLIQDVFTDKKRPFPTFLPTFCIRSLAQRPHSVSGSRGSSSHVPTKPQKGMAPLAYETSPLHRLALFPVLFLCLDTDHSPLTVIPHKCISACAWSLIMKHYWHKNCPLWPSISSFKLWVANAITLGSWRSQKVLMLLTPCLHPT